MSNPSFEDVFYRVSNRHRLETVDSLDRQSKQAVAHPDFAVHGVSIRTADNLHDLRLFPSAPRNAIEAHFPIRKTGPQPWHYTVELPDPVTQEDADMFNWIFGK